MNALAKAINHQRDAYVVGLVVYEGTRHCSAKDAQNRNALHTVLTDLYPTYTTIMNAMENMELAAKLVTDDSVLSFALELKNGDFIEWSGDSDTLEKYHPDFKGARV